MWIYFIAIKRSGDIEEFSSLTLKCLLLGMKQFLATESPFKIMKNALYFTLKALFVLEIFKFLF